MMACSVSLPLSCELIKIHQWENNQQLVIPFIGVFHPTITSYRSVLRKSIRSPVGLMRDQLLMFSATEGKMFVFFRN